MPKISKINEIRSDKVIINIKMVTFVTRHSERLLPFRF